MAYHSFMGELKSGNQTVPVISYFLYGKVPVWSMSEIQKPCFDMPMSILVKEIASKINRSALHYSASDVNLKEINERMEELMILKQDLLNIQQKIINRLDKIRTKKASPST